MSNYLDFISEGSDNTDRYEEYMGVVDTVTSPIPNEHFLQPPLEWKVVSEREDTNETTASSFFFGISEDTFFVQSGDGLPEGPVSSWETFDENVESNERELPWMTRTTTTTETTVTAHNTTNNRSTLYISTSDTTPTVGNELVSRWPTTENTTRLLSSQSLTEKSTSLFTSQPLRDMEATTEREMWRTTVQTTASNDSGFNSLSEEHVIIISSVCAVFVVLIVISILLWFLLVRKRVRRRRVGVESQDEESEKDIEATVAQGPLEGNRNGRPSIAGSKRSNNSSEDSNMHLHSAVDESRRQAWTNGTNS